MLNIIKTTFKKNQSRSNFDVDQSGNTCFKVVNYLALILSALAIILFIASFFTSNHLPLLLIALLLLLATAACIIFKLRREITLKLVVPLNKIITWSEQMTKGNLNARITRESQCGYPVLIKNINKLSEKISLLSNEMQQEVDKQTQRIAQKNHVLEVLYDAAASINISKNLEDLLLRFLPTLKKVVNAEAATVRLTNYDGQMRLIGSIGLDNSDKQQQVELLIPVLHCMYGKKVEEGDLLCKDRVLQCEIYPGQPFYTRKDIEMIAVPLQYREKNLGVYNLFVKKPGLIDGEDVKDLLISIGRHLGIAIEKAHTEEESRQLSIYRERSLLSHELHDSLAQTLASLKFQVRTLDNSMKQGAYQDAVKELDQLRNGLDEAYTELRELIAHFRAPFDERGIVSAIENVIHQFRESSDISLYFQNEWQEGQLSSLYEIQVLRIIQESLNNIKKHSQARSVRVMLSYDQNARHTVLIEDDGIGISEPLLTGSPGEQIGLTIMKERAHRLGGELNIESEPGEGTQIKLTFSVKAADLIDDKLKREVIEAEREK